MNEKPAILYIDDDEQNCISFKAAFRRSFTIHTALGAAEGLKILQTENIKVILTDQRMPVTKGTELLIKLFNECNSAIPILVTAYSDLKDIIEGINNGNIFRCVQNPGMKNYCETIYMKHWKNMTFTKPAAIIIQKLMKKTKITKRSKNSKKVTKVLI